MKSDNVTNISDHLKCNSKKTLEYLIEQDAAGMLDGFVVAAQIKGQPDYTTFTGTYKKDPDTAIGPIGRLYDIVSKAIKDKGGLY